MRSRAPGTILAAPTARSTTRCWCSRFSRRRYQPRFRFSLNTSDKDAGPGIWVLEYKEQTRPTLIRAPPNGDLVAKGRIWIESETGRVVKTELAVGELDNIVTSFRFDERFQIAVPHDMREEFWTDTESIVGVATYSRFRRFDVSTEEEFQEPRAARASLTVTPSTVVW